ncbi:Scaffold-type E3 ligase [Didymella heteroderae]|uniref:Defective in cullin neddylation protein n=1 Tax=Didymella heteroderae TaxID=1769908 RepID=A0A9P4WNJ7_9PLEO|nr:Scaffold-type E3 ligase [Didymella heteroderae]
MQPKRRAPDTEMVVTPVKKKAKAMREAYTTQQKAAISQFMSFTNMDRTAAVRVLKSHGWDAQNAVNAQLAGRQRWKRISSSGSSSSKRSVSSSSQVSQLSHRETSSIFEQIPPRPTPIPVHISSTRFVSADRLHDFGGLQHLVQTIAASDVEEAFSYYSGGGGSNASAATKTTLNKLFDKYRDNATTEPDLIGVDGAMKYLQELEIDFEDIDSLAALEIIQAPTMGEIAREGFVNGWLERDCDTIEKQKTYINNLKTQLPSDRTVFTRVYKYTFLLAKTGQQKAVPLEQAMDYWNLLFSSRFSAVKWASPNTPWLAWWKEFLEVSWKKSVNKDMWNETLKFAQLTLEDEAISFWNEESSWPSVIDDFVEWVKNEKRGGAEQKTEEMEY